MQAAVEAPSSGSEGSATRGLLPRNMENLILAVAAAAMFLMLAWPFLQDTTKLAVTRDPAWYTWRAKALLEADPSLLLTKHGPFGMLTGGYRVVTPVLGALLNRVAGVAPQRFAILVMVGTPVLASLALGAFAFRHKRDRLLVLLTLLASVGLFLTTPFLGYLDDVTCLFILATALPFLEPARTSWGARSALALLGWLAFLTHPTTTGIFVLVLLAGMAIRFLAYRFSFRRAWLTDGPTFLSFLVGVLAGAAFWKLGLWGAKSAFSESVLTQPYPASFFRARLGSWVQSMHPKVTLPLALLAVAWIVWMVAKRRPEGRDWHSRMSLLWLLPLIGTFGFVLGKAYPYYRFINTTLAPMLLVGLGLWVLVWLAARAADRVGGGGARAIRWGAVVVVLAAVSLLFLKPGYSAWSRQEPFIDKGSLTDVSAARAYAAVEGDRPIVFVIYPDASAATTWGASKQSMNLTLAALSGEEVARSFFYVGSPESFLAQVPTETDNALFNRISKGFLADEKAGLAAFDTEPVVFWLKAFNPDPNANPKPELLTEVAPNVSLVVGAGAAPVDPAAQAAAQRDRAAEARKLANPPSLTSGIGHAFRVMVGLFLLLVLPGLIAMRWFELDDFPSRIALIPGLSLGLVVTSGVLILAVNRGPFSTLDGWASVALALIVATVLAALTPRFRRRPTPATTVGPEADGSAGSAAAVAAR